MGSLFGHRSSAFATLVHRHIHAETMLDALRADM